MNDYVSVTVLENEIEARLLDSILQERGIPHWLRINLPTPSVGNGSPC